jgi:cytochrome bd-type quinol oxidase subunit 2
MARAKMFRRQLGRGSWLIVAAVCVALVFTTLSQHHNEAMSTINRLPWQAHAALLIFIAVSFVEGIRPGPWRGWRPFWLISAAVIVLGECQSFGFLSKAHAYPGYLILDMLAAMLAFIYALRPGIKPNHGDDVGRRRVGA